MNLKTLINQSTIDVAKNLLGTIMTTNVRGKITSGIIVETEAYGGKDIIDPACHAHKGLTPRTKTMFCKPGTSYVYFIYGMYHCVNIVTEDEGIGAAVLIRALEPIHGIEIMRKRRNVKKDQDLTNGPGKLCIAMGIDLRMLGEDTLTSNKIFIKPYMKFSPSKIASSGRIGISNAKDFHWRFYVKNNIYVSKTFNTA